MPFIAPIIAAAAPLVASIGAAWAAIGVLGQTAVLIGLSVASSYLIKQFTPKAAAPPGGVQFEKQYGTNVPRQVAMGKVGIAGHDAYINTTGHDNYYAQQIFIVSDYYTTALSRVWINGELVSLGDGPGESFAVLSGKSAGYVWFTFYDGRQTTASGTLVTFSNPPGRWSEDNVGTGVSFIVAEIAYDKDNHNEYPEFFFEVLGAPLYDWRKDDTAGGTGDHRWSDVATHEFSENPIVMEYNYRRGLTISDDPLCGMFMPSSDLPLAKYTTAANLCDELDGDGQERYRCSVMVDCGPQTSFGEIIKSFALSCGAMSIDGVDGSWPLVGSDQPTAFTFTDKDIISTADYKYSAKKSMGDLVNSVMGNFPDINQQWSPIGYTPQIDDALIIIDRRSRDVSIDFPMVYWSRQASNLASIYLYENRYEASATVTLRPRFQGAEAGDWCVWQSDRYGWTKTFLVASRALVSLSGDGPRNVVLTLEERDGAIYDGVTPATITIPTPNDAPIYIDEVENFALVAVSVTGADGRATPAIRVSWDTITDNTVDQVELRWYPTAQSTSVMSKIVDAKRTVIFLADGIVSNTDYTVQARIIATPARTTVFNAGDEVTTSNIMVGTIDLDAAITYQITTLQDLFVDKMNEFEALVSSMVSEQDVRNWLDKKSIRSQLSSRSDAAFAEIEHVSAVLTGVDVAMASDITSLFAGTNSGTGTVNITAQALSTLTNDFANYQITVASTYATQTDLDDTNFDIATLSSNVTTNYVSNSSLSGTLASYSTTAIANATYGKIAGIPATFTVTIASPGVVTWNAHSLVAGDAFRPSTTGALPTGMTPGSYYYVLPTGLTANTFQFSATPGGAAINTTGSQSGTHTGTPASMQGVTASVSSQGTAIATLNGYAASQYSVTLNVNGYATGFNLFNGGSGTSAFIIVADKFQVQFPSYNGNAPYSVFTTGLVNGVASVGINGNLYLDGNILARHMSVNSITAANGAIADLAVESIKIKGNAVTVPQVQPFTNVAVGTSSTTLASFNMSIDTTGLNGVSIPIYAIVSIMNSVLSTVSWNASLVINGTTVGSGPGGSFQAQSCTLTGSTTITGNGSVMSINVNAVANFAAGSFNLTGALFAMAAKR